MTSTINPTYDDYARDLRTLAAHFVILADRLPLPRYPEQGLGIDVYMASHLDVDQAAKILGVPTGRHNGYTTAKFGTGTVKLRFIHVSDTAMAEYNARQAYAATMPTTEVSS